MMTGLALLTALSLPAFAQDVVDVWSYTDYPDEETLDGVDGWSSGYSDDEWYGYEGELQRYALPLTDDNGGTWGDGGPYDIWLINDEAVVGDGILVSSVYSEDDDSIGLVLRWQDPDNYLLFIMTGTGRAEGSSPIEDGVYAALVEIRDGEANVLDDVSDSYDQYNLHAFAVGANDDEVFALLWAELDTSDDPIIELSATGVDDIGIGLGGFYAYDAGYDGGGGGNSLCSLAASASRHSMTTRTASSMTRTTASRSRTPTRKTATATASAPPATMTREATSAAMSAATLAAVVTRLAAPERTSSSLRAAAAAVLAGQPVGAGHRTAARSAATRN